MRILGIDASLTATGFVVIETDGIPGDEKLLLYEVVRTISRDGDDATRSELIATRAACLARGWEAELVGLELPFVGQNASTALRLRGLGATIETMLRERGYPVVSISPASVKSALGIPPRTPRIDAKRLSVSRAQRQHGVVLTDDEADAIGVALAAHKKQARLLKDAALGIKPKPKKRRKRTPKLRITPAGQAALAAEEATP